MLATEVEVEVGWQPRWRRRRWCARGRGCGRLEEPLVKIEWRWSHINSNGGSGSGSVAAVVTASMAPNPSDAGSINGSRCDGVCWHQLRWRRWRWASKSCPSLVVWSIGMAGSSELTAKWSQGGGLDGSRGLAMEVRVLWRKFINPATRSATSLCVAQRAIQFAVLFWSRQNRNETLPFELDKMTGQSNSFCQFLNLEFCFHFAQWQNFS